MSMNLRDMVSLQHKIHDSMWIRTTFCLVFMNRLQVSPTNAGNSDNFQSNGMRGYLQLMGVIESKVAILQASILLCCQRPFGDSLLNEAFGGLS